ncbi:MAG TPA: bifunctional rhamnulose-1-phosphate aldolase/short-chain dehydrogenase, partial [Candidatus Binatus sp.]|nr:bifunctional rhamnulose-1-phosphate aldolase/short-chain dehydrogenase [Candidatus Binatus sp.]
QERLLGLEKSYRGLAHEDEVAARLPYCVFGTNPRAPSIDTPLHAFLPFAHVDHMHPDAIIAIATARDGERFAADAFSEELGWLGWQRPGFDLALRIRDLVRSKRRIRGVILAGHGLITWGASSKECYRNTIEVIGRAEEWLKERTRDVKPLGGSHISARSPEERSKVASELMPVLRSKLSTDHRKVGHYSDDDEILDFVNSAKLEILARLGTSCLDHFLRTKIRPLVLPTEVETAPKNIDRLIDRYRTEYTSYYERCRRSDSPSMRDASHVVVLMPAIGMFTFASSKTAARIAAEFYRNAVRVMRGASAISEYVALPEQEAFDIEYWALEDAKLKRQLAAKPLASRIAIVTGGAGGIGRAVAARLLEDDCCVVLLDIDGAARDAARESLVSRFDSDRVRAFQCDVTNENDVASAFAYAAREYGGIDIVVSNAGIASSAPIESTSLEVWERNQSVLSTGYFLIAREAARLLKHQGMGGSIVFVASKNALAASAGAAAYNAAKAAELHLARTLALELAPHGIRVNAVNP